MPAPESKNQRTITRVRGIVEAVGSVERGRVVFENKEGANCAKCHSLQPGEELVGPSLATIGSKYAKEGLFDSILNPSAGISPEYYSWILDTTTYGLVTGLLAEDSPERTIVRTETGDEIRLEPGEIVERRQSKLSIMPEDLVNTMTEQDLIDLLEFLVTLREESAMVTGFLSQCDVDLRQYSPLFHPVQKQIAQRLAGWLKFKSPIRPLAGYENRL